MSNQNLQRHRGQYRFWYPIDYRYEYYSWPKTIIGRCSHCQGRVIFDAVIPERFVKDENSGGERLVIAPIGGNINGRGVCTKCSHLSGHLSWPQEAFYKVSIGGQDIWAWNEKYLEVLKAKVSGDRVLERKLCLENTLYRYFLSRIPKHVVEKRNREKILRKFSSIGSG
ncbi:hypothetical protein [Shewanella sp. SM29]|uniref:hypothetical protein n=1 Tax=Shewanella sp. SM29 TaxID=2912795 RepID=UPI0021DA04B4|nr:hypothetical protein [Shewanella sp. SM29]MCU8075884.1 hypothetical protein [Shewanella sp. SM29]